MYAAALIDAEKPSEAINVLLEAFLVGFNKAQLLDDYDKLRLVSIMSRLADLYEMLQQDKDAKESHDKAMTLLLQSFSKVEARATDGIERQGTRQRLA